MKKTLILVLLFLVLGGAAFYMMKKKDVTTTAVVTDDRNFAVKDISTIGKVFIANRNGAKVTLELIDGQWMVEGKYKARENAIENLMHTISTIEMKYIPPQSAIPNIVKGLASSGIKVEIYDKAGKNLTTYYVGGTDNNIRATYCIIEGAEQPYAMHMPMMEGSLRPRYQMSITDWRDRTIFRYKPEQIEEVSIEYPKQKSKSFKLQKEKGQFTVKPFYDSSPAYNKPYRKGSAETFLMEFGNLAAEAIVNHRAGRDSIEAMIPFAVVSVKDTKGEVASGTFHSIRKTDAEGNPLTDDKVSVRTAVERYHVSTSSGDFMLVQQVVFGKIFWSYESFFE